MKIKRFFSVLLIAAFVIYNVLSSKYFALTAVKIQGTKALRLRDVLSLLQIQPEQKFYFLPLSSFEQKLKAHPKIRNARVVREFPHTLQVKLEERKPLFAVKENGFTYVLDEDRVVMDKVSSTELLLPEVQGITLDAKPGQKMDDRRFALTVQCLKSSDAVYPLRISTLAFSDMEMVLYTDHGLKVKLGDGKNIPEKMERLKVVLQAVRKKNIPVKYIDLQSMDRPAIGVDKQPEAPEESGTKKNT